MSTGPRGIQGSSGSSNPLSSKWILTTASSAADINPDSGKVKLYASGGGAVISFSSTTQGDRDMSQFGVALDKLNDNYDATLTLVQVDDPSTHITIDIISITGPYSSGGTTAFSVEGTLASSSGTMTQGQQFTITAGNRGEQGVQGYQGAQGYRGHPGTKGIQGVQGYQGWQGMQGVGPLRFLPWYGQVDAGWNVNKGYQGHPANPAPPGIQGYQGPQGVPGGHQGHQGVPGQTGPVGNIGDSPQGPQGLQGDPGAQGLQGDPGDVGQSQGYQGHPGNSPVGYPGPRGYQGETGPIGYDGHPGVTGAKGLTGVQGSQGPQGSIGSQGSQGYQGEFGYVGDTGPQGHRGNQGSSGQGFVISKVYNSEAARIAATGASLPADGEFGLVAGMLDASFDDYGKLYLYKTATGWAYQADMSIGGLLGSQGAQGDRGPQGAQGNSAANNPGPQGDVGNVGNPGDRGPQGYQAGASTSGPQGYQGDRGIQGTSSLGSAPAGTGLIYVDSGTLDPTLYSLGLGMEISGSSGSRVLVVGPQRPALDSNHVHVYNCNEAPGSTTLIDSGTGGKNLTLQGAVNTDYTLQETRYGSVPWLRSLRDANTSPVALSSTHNTSFSAFSIELVAVFNSLPAGARSIVQMQNTAGPIVGVTNVAYLNMSDGNMRGGLAVNGSTETYTATNSLTIPVVGIPNHYMVVYDPTLASPNIIKLYANGVLVATAGLVQHSTSNITGMSVFQICGYNTLSRSSQCYIRDIRVSNIARSATYAMQMANALTHL